MTIKEQLEKEIESAPESVLEKTLNFVRFLKTKQPEAQPIESQVETPIQSTGSSLLEHLKTIGTWEGDDLEECLQMVYATRGKRVWSQRKKQAEKN